MADTTPKQQHQKPELPLYWNYRRRQQRTEIDPEAKSPTMTGLIAQHLAAQSAESARQEYLSGALDRSERRLAQKVHGKEVARMLKKQQPPLDPEDREKVVEAIIGPAIQGALKLAGRGVTAYNKTKRAALHTKPGSIYRRARITKRRIARKAAKFGQAHPVATFIGGIAKDTTQKTVADVATERIKMSQSRKSDPDYDLYLRRLEYERQNKTGRFAHPEWQYSAPERARRSPITYEAIEEANKAASTTHYSKMHPQHSAHVSVIKSQFGATVQKQMAKIPINDKKFQLASRQKTNTKRASTRSEEKNMNDTPILENAARIHEAVSFGRMVGGGASKLGKASAQAGLSAAGMGLVGAKNILNRSIGEDNLTEVLPALAPIAAMGARILARPAVAGAIRAVKPIASKIAQNRIVRDTAASTAVGVGAERATERINRKWRQRHPSPSYGPSN